MSARDLVAAVLLVAGCARPVRDAGTRVPPLPDAIAAIQPAVERGAVVVFGELHGTREVPAFVGDVVSELARRGNVVLALEIPGGHTPALARYLASDGGDAARTQLLADPFWAAAYQDGRRSVAMLALLDRLRADHAAVDVVGFDIDGAGSPEQRDRSMAENLAGLRKQRPGDAIVVLVGSLHGARGELAFFPGRGWMAGFLVEAGVEVVSLDLRHAGGSAWTCIDGEASHCGMGEVGARPASPGIHLAASTDGNYDGWFGVGSLTAAPPAIAPDRTTARAAIPATNPLYERAAAAYDAGDFAACAAAYAEIPDPSPVEAYNHACCHARAGAIEAAFERLQFAVDHGLGDLAAVETDRDLEGLHDDPRWGVITRGATK